MPNSKIHCKNSLKRTGKDYKELHEWMDEGCKYLKKNHRFERHSTSYIPYVMKTWKKEGVLEFLKHIIEDYEDTLRKYETTCEVCGEDTIKGFKLCKKCWSIKNVK